MSNRRITPPYGVMGFWEVKAPFKVVTGKEYRCAALRSFVELQMKGVDVYATFYAPQSIEQSVYESDADAAAVIVVLVGKDGEVLHIPDTYITKYPDFNGGDYRRFILSCELGTLPKNATVTNIMETVRTEVEKALGRRPNVAVHLADIKDEEMSPTDRVREEQTRLNGVTNKKSNYGRLVDANRKIADYETLISRLRQRLSSIEVKNHETHVLEERLKTTEESLRQARAEISTLTRSNATLRKDVERKDQRILALETIIRQLGGKVPD